MSSDKKSFGAFTPRGRTAHLRGPKSSCSLHQHLTEELKQTESEKLKWLIELGAVYVNKDRRQDPSSPVHEADLIRVHLEPKRYDVKKDLIEVVHETTDFVILNKPTGVPMHATLDNAVENLAHGFHEKLYVTHRLDVPTSGLVLFAKNKAYQAHFNDVVAQRKVIKRYQALTLKSPALGLHRHFMVVEDRAPKTLLTEVEAQSSDLKLDECLLEVLSSSETEFNLGKPIPTFGPGFSNEISLLTGRTHQIRAQLSKIGAPIVGDEMYGGMKAALFGLHACYLAFENYKFEKKRDWRAQTRHEEA